jgi:hypothetical protein
MIRSARRCLPYVLAALLLLPASAGAETIIGGVSGSGFKPKTVYFGNDGLKNVHWSVWTNTTAVGTGTLEPGGASCSQDCAHPRLTIVYSLPAVAPCGAHGSRVESFTYALLSTGAYYRLGDPGACTWYARGFIKSGVLG